MNEAAGKFWMIIAVLIVTVASLFYLYRLYHVNPAIEGSEFLPCPLHAATGLKCPGCGSQRAVHELMHGEIRAAFHWNALLVISIPYLLLGLYPQKTRWLQAIYRGKRTAWIAFGIVVVYAVWRNTSLYPLH